MFGYPSPAAQGGGAARLKTTEDTTMTALENRIASLTTDQLVDVLRSLATDTGDEAARITTAGLARLYQQWSEDRYVALCDELYGAWG
jgi:hypothetical protein